jgi:hypothetical protein
MVEGIADVEPCTKPEHNLRTEIDSWRNPHPQGLRTLPADSTDVAGQNAKRYEDRVRWLQQARRQILTADNWSQQRLPKDFRSEPGPQRRRYHVQDVNAGPSCYRQEIWRPFS